MSLLDIATWANQHMYQAAMQNKAFKMTVLGEHYRRLIEQGLQA